MRVGFPAALASLLGTLSLTLQGRDIAGGRPAPEPPKAWAEDLLIHIGIWSHLPGFKRKSNWGGKGAFIHVFAPEDLPVPLACFSLQQHGAQKEWGRLSPRATLDGPGDHVLRKVSGPHFPAPPEELFQDHPHLQEGAPLCRKSSTHSRGSQVGSLGR